MKFSQEEIYQNPCEILGFRLNFKRNSFIWKSSLTCTGWCFWTSGILRIMVTDIVIKASCHQHQSSCYCPVVYWLYDLGALFCGACGTIITAIVNRGDRTYLKQKIINHIKNKTHQIRQSITEENLRKRDYLSLSLGGFF